MSFFLRLDLRLLKGTKTTTEHLHCWQRSTNSAPPRLRFLIPALIIAAAMLAVVTAGVASLLVCALIAAMLMVLLGIMSEQEARNAVNWEVYVTIACAFGIGIALEKSGIAGGVANFLVRIGTAIGIGGK